ncbi:UDP-N-acetylmuramoyl-L-alanyl-D-glutamate--2,6-diaminopimelate ligase [Candidatus Parcubacteria bacterium]|nr:UDP-N-acetylmuramoyl-L-alanyl-D-glutamate--2,6-diaminopimelate ligase [Candidatus Parcubacteria bacterium]
MIKDSIKKFIPVFLLDFYHFSLAGLGAFLYGFPAKKIKVIGVTGTNGKTTVVSLAAKILEETGYKVASISSIKFKLGEKEWKNDLKMTMPGRLKLQKFLRQAVKAGCRYVVLEVTSEGIKQHRHRFIDFDTAVFTNLTPEHIESHGSFEKYKEAKGKLFQATKNIHIINLDDKNAEYFLKFPARKKYTYGLEKGDINTKNTQFKLNLFGEFNIYNSLAAICIGLSQGVDLETSQNALEKIKAIPGRMEKVIGEPFTPHLLRTAPRAKKQNMSAKGAGFTVIVDYAHTPDALENVYKTIQGSMVNSQESKVICVLGSAGGGRDKWKRPEMGKIAGKYCDEIILTNEDPYDENPLKILKEIENGIRTNSRLDSRRFTSIHKILDRREAIKKALTLAKFGDIVIITGKGCEPWMCVADGKKIPWDDRQIVKEELRAHK